MIRCIIIDDEPLALQQMEAYVKKIPYLAIKFVQIFIKRIDQIMVYHF